MLVLLSFSASCGEDTDDASETDRAKLEEATEIKEQMYREKLAQLKQQIELLHAGTLPEFCRKQKKLEQAAKERHKQIQCYHNYLLSKVARLSSRTFVKFQLVFSTCRVKHVERFVALTLINSQHIKSFPKHFWLHTTGTILGLPEPYFGKSCTSMEAFLR